MQYMPVRVNIPTWCVSRIDLLFGERTNMKFINSTGLLAVLTFLTMSLTCFAENPFANEEQATGRVITVSSHKQATPNNLKRQERTVEPFLVIPARRPALFDRITDWLGGPIPATHLANPRKPIKNTHPLSR